MWHTNTLNLPHCWLLRVTEKNLKKSTEMKCGKGKRAKCEAPQWITVGNSSLAPRGRGWWDVHCTFPRCQHFHWGASTAAGPQLKNLAKISIFTAHFRIFSAEDALTLKKIPSIYIWMKHSSCLLCSYYFGLPCIYLQALLQHAQQSSVI